MKTVGLKGDKHEKAINIKNSFSFFGNVILYEARQTYLRACRSSRMFRALPPKNPTLPPYVKIINWNSKKERKVTLLWWNIHKEFKTEGYCWTSSFMPWVEYKSFGGNVAACRI